MKRAIYHSYEAETMEFKSRWFQSLSLEERMDLFCAFTDLILQNNPKILETKNAQPVAGRIQVLSKSDLIRSKRAAGRDIDLEDVRILRSKK